MCVFIYDYSRLIDMLSLVSTFDVLSKESTCGAFVMGLKKFVIFHPESVFYKKKHFQTLLSLMLRDFDGSILQVWKDCDMLSRLLWLHSKSDLNADDK